jgi:hypothetical protein
VAVIYASFPCSVGPLHAVQWRAGPLDGSRTTAR